MTKLLIRTIVVQPYLANNGDDAQSFRGTLSILFPFAIAMVKITAQKQVV